VPSSSATETVISPVDPSVRSYVQVNVLPTVASSSCGQSTVSTFTDPGPSIVSRTFFSTAAVSTVVGAHATRTPSATARPAALVKFMDAG
jgi:hypothetical protein